MDPTHVMSFAGAGGILESITLFGVSPDHVDQVTVCKGGIELVRAETVDVDDERPELLRVSAGRALAARSAMEGRSGIMRISLGEHGQGVRTSGAPVVFSAWMGSALPDGEKLQLALTFRPDR